MLRTHTLAYYISTSVQTWTGQTRPVQPWGSLGASWSQSGAPGRRSGPIPAGPLDHSAFTVAAADFLFGQPQG